MFARIAASFIFWLVILGSSAAPGYSDDGDAIGEAIKVVNEVKAELNQAIRTLATKDDVRQNELISVGNDSLGEIELNDETKLALGPGARLKLDKFVYDPNKTGGAIVINMTRGAFRFITGLAKKPTYVIRTPAASITVRGTIFDVYVEETGGMWLLLHEGAIQVCNDTGKCQQLDDPCQSLHIGDGGEVGSPGIWNTLKTDRDVDFDVAFPFIDKPPTIGPDVKLIRSDVEQGKCPGREPTKTRRAEPKPKKKTAAKEPAKSTPKKKKTDEGAEAAKAIGLAIGIGISIGGSKGGKKGHSDGDGMSKPPMRYPKPSSDIAR
jgi:hypothetical protein